MSDISRIAQAVEFAAIRHAHQRRKGASEAPYFNHLAAVAANVAKATGGRDPNLVIAAYLHDCIEDCGVSRAEIAEIFGEDVASLVAEVTDDKSLPKEARKRQQVEHAAHVPHGAKLIKLADKTANLRDLADFPPADWPAFRRREYFDWAALVVGQVRGAHPGLEGLFDAAHARRPD